ncbi:MAG: methyltransferase domain-containing protein [Candidatus Thorarchaeota archaeon]
MVVILEEKSKIYNKKKKIIEKYNSTSDFYDKRYKAIQEEKYEIALKNYKDNKNHLLDLGCGTGLLFEYFINSNLEKEIIKNNYIGVDISWNMLLKFKSKSSKSEYTEYSPNLILADIEHLPFRKNIFYSIFSFTSFQNLPDTKIGIKELLLVSKNNAYFKFSILKKNLELDSLLRILKTNLKEVSILQKQNLEDVIIQGRIFKA